MDTLHIVVGIVGILFGGASVLLTLRFRKSKRPTCVYLFKSLYKRDKSAPRALRAKYKDELVRNFSAIQLIFWNNGKEPITKKDVVDPITFMTESGIKIFRAKVMHPFNSHNEFRVSVSQCRSEVTLNFNHLDQKEGVCIEILSDCCDAYDFDGVYGKILACKEIRETVARPWLVKHQEKVILISSIIGALSVGVIALLLLLRSPIIFWIILSTIFHIVITVALLVGTSFIVTMFISVLITDNRCGFGGMPKKFKTILRNKVRN